MKKLVLLALISLSGLSAHADLKLTIMPSTCEEGNQEYPFVSSAELGKEIIVKDSDYNLDNGTKLGRALDTDNGSVAVEIMKSKNSGHVAIHLTYVPKDQRKPRLMMLWRPTDFSQITTIVSGSACESQRDVGADSIGLILQKIESAK